MEDDRKREERKVVIKEEIREAAILILMEEEGPLSQTQLVEILQKKGFFPRIIKSTLKELGTDGEELVFGWLSNSNRILGKKGGALIWMLKETLMPEGAAFFPRLSKKEFGRLVRREIVRILERSGKILSPEEIHREIVEIEGFEHYSLEGLRGILYYDYRPIPGVRFEFIKDKKHFWFEEED